MYKLTFFVPLESKEQVKEALFQAGAGQVGAYKHCSFEVVGEGQFTPLSGANPTIGQVGRPEKVTEARVEMMASPECLSQVLKALHQSHPYETPAYDVVECLKTSTPPPS